MTRNAMKRLLRGTPGICATCPAPISKEMRLHGFVQCDECVQLKPLGAERPLPADTAARIDSTRTDKAASGIPTKE